MPRRKKGTRRTHHRRRHRMSGTMKLTPARQNGIERIIGAVIGAVGKRFIDTAISKQTTVTISENGKKLINVVEGLVGVAVNYFSDMPFVQGVGIGIAGEAGVTALQQTGMLNGIGETNMKMLDFRKMKKPRLNMSGASTTPSVAGANVYNFPSPGNVGKIKRMVASM